MAWMGLAALGAAFIDEGTGLPKAQACNVDDASGETENFGELPLYQCLGLTALPAEPTEDGKDYAEAVITQVDGRWVILGGRDARTATIVGNMKPGDTVVHSTGPSQAAQLQLKEQKRQAVLATKDTQNKQAMVILDGKNDIFSVVAFGNAFEISRDQGFVYSSANGKNGISVSDEYVHLRGTVILGGMAPNPAMSIMLGPVTGSLGGASASPMVAAKGVFVGL